MKNKIKKIGYGVASAVAAAPALALAQFAPPSPTDTGLANTSITEIITTVMQWILSLVGLFGVIAFAIAGILYLTAAGDEARAGKAKSTMLYAIIGVVVALVGLIALTAINTLLGGNEGA